MITLAGAMSTAELGVSLAEMIRNDKVQIAVEDQGSGVSEGDREMIFKQFYTKDVKEGTGLGLAICKGIVEAHGGEIGFQMAESGGSRFWLSIPRNQHKEQMLETKTACR